MVHPLPGLQSLFPVHSLPARVAGDPELRRVWLREVILLWVRWQAALLILLLLVLFPTRSRLLGGALLLVLVVANTALTRLLFDRHYPVRLRRLRPLGIGLDWCIVSVLLLVFSTDLAAVAPIAVLAVQVTSSIRYRLPGAATSFAGAVLLIAAWAGMHLLAFDALAANRVPALAVAWVTGSAWFASLQFLVIAGGQQLRSLEQALHAQERDAERARHADEIAALRRARHGLSERELELLPYLARPDLKTQGDIGRVLPDQISGRTVGMHIHRMAQKFEVTGGRWAVVHVARERGLVDAVELGKPVADTDEP